jgi:HEAT repeat protein
VAFLNDTLKKGFTDVADKLTCVQILGQIGPPAATAIPALANALDEERLRAEAGVALSRMGKVAVNSLLKKLTSADAKTRLVCINTLGQIATDGNLTAQTLAGILLSLRNLAIRESVPENRDALTRVINQIQGKR